MILTQWGGCCANAPIFQTADQLLARADAAKALAEEASKKGKSTYQEAQDILGNLRG